MADELAVRAGYAKAALQGGRYAEAVAAYGALRSSMPDDPHVAEQFAIALEGVGRLDEAEALLRVLLDRQPGFFVARLFLARACQRLGRMDQAYEFARAAIRDAQRLGQWRSPATTPQWLNDVVRQMLEFVRLHRYERFRAALAPLKRNHRPEAFDRLNAFIAGYVGVKQPAPTDPRQRPRKQYFPGLPTTPWIDPALLPWTELLERHAHEIREELVSLFDSGQEFQPFLKFSSAAQVPTYLGTSGPPPQWNAFFFYRHGQRDDRNCEICPRTAAILDRLPLVKLDGFSPEICFSVLTPGTHIKPHHGDANARNVVHLPLMVPPNCALRVGGETREWVDGKVLAFDDTFEHEAWNRSDSTRVILLLDCWSPHLTPVEIEGLQLLASAMQKEASERRGSAALNGVASGRDHG